MSTTNSLRDRVGDIRRRAEAVRGCPRPVTAPGVPVPDEMRSKTLKKRASILRGRSISRSVLADRDPACRHRLLGICLLCACSRVDGRRVPDRKGEECMSAETTSEAHACLHATDEAICCAQTAGAKPFAVRMQQCGRPMVPERDHVVHHDGDHINEHHSVRPTTTCGVLRPSRFRRPASVARRLLICSDIREAASPARCRCSTAKVVNAEQRCHCAKCAQRAGRNPATAIGPATTRNTLSRVRPYVLSGGIQTTGAATARGDVHHEPSRVVSGAYNAHPHSKPPSAAAPVKVSSDCASGVREQTSCTLQRCLRVAQATNPTSKRLRWHLCRQPVLRSSSHPWRSVAVALPRRYQLGISA